MAKWLKHDKTKVDLISKENQLIKYYLKINCYGF